jgi:hypothetical protein
MPPRKDTIALAALALLAVTSLTAHQVRADVILGAAAGYGVLVEPNANSVQTSNGTIIGNIGIGGNTATPPGPADLQNTSGTIQGNVDFANPTGTVQNAIIGNINHNVSAVTSALTTVNNYASQWAAEALDPTKSTAVAISIGNGGDQTIDASTGTLDANGNRIFNVTGSFNLNSNSDTHGLTITGLSTDYVVINFSDLQNINGAILFGGGLAGTTDHVFFNYTGTQNFTASSNHHELSGDFLAVNAKVTWNAVTLDGRLVGGSFADDFQMNSGFNLNAPPVTPNVVPEPATVVSSIFPLLLGLGYAWRRRFAVS